MEDIKNEDQMLKDKIKQIGQEKLIKLTSIISTIINIIIRIANNEIEVVYNEKVFLCEIKNIDDFKINQRFNIFNDLIFFEFTNKF